MIFYKIWYHLKALLQLLLFKMIYGNCLKIGGAVTWRDNFVVMIDRGAKITIDDNCFFNNGCSLVAMNEISIGNGTLFGENVKVYDHNHKFRDKNRSIKEQGFSIAPVKIGKHCWIGSNVVILKGVTIGDNCVIGAGCVVSEDVEPNTIVTTERRLIKSAVHD